MLVLNKYRLLYYGLGLLVSLVSDLRGKGFSRYVHEYFSPLNGVIDFFPALYNGFAHALSDFLRYFLLVLTIYSLILWLTIVK